MSHGDRSSCARRGEAITTVIVWLLMGAIVNVAVAWGFVIFTDPLAPNQHHEFSRGPAHLPASERYRVRKVSRLGSVRFKVTHESISANDPPTATMSVEEILPSWARGFFDIPELEGRALKTPEEARTSLMLMDGRGWPFLSLAGGSKIPMADLRRQYAAQGVTLVNREHWMIPLQSRSARLLVDEIEWLPLRPIWPGFAINTLLYAAILWGAWLLFAAPFALRRRLRIKRGLCPACAYPIGASEVCTECGKRVRLRGSI